MFGVSLRGRDELKQAIGQEIIDRIIRRTESGKAIGGKKDLKKPYSESYAESLDFKAFGKSKNKVNMKLTGDMLGSMDVTEIKGNKITIGFEGDEENAKAFNHNFGDTVPKRPFFGLNKNELTDIKRTFKSELKEALKEQRSGDDNLLLGLIEKLGGDDGSES